MPKIRETVDIEAPADSVWAVVQEDAVHAPRWSTNLKKIEKLDDGPPRVGTRYRYHLDIPGTDVKLEVQQDVYDKPRRCSGRFIKGPLKGTWGYTYRQAKDHTHVVYEMDYELGGLLRFAGGLLARQYAEGIHKNMSRLKDYVESGKGPKPTATKKPKAK